MIDGLPTGVYWLVKVRVPLSRSTRKTVTLSAHWLQQYENRPVGSKLKLRGELLPANPAGKVESVCQVPRRVV